MEGSRLGKENTVSNVSNFYNNLKFTEITGKLTFKKNLFKSGMYFGSVSIFLED